MTQPTRSPLLGRFQRLVSIKQEELAPLCWGWLYIFSLLCAYYILRPIRDTVSTLTGAHSLPWLFTAVLITMLLLQWPYNRLSQRLPRERFISYSYQACALILCAFALGFARHGGLHDLFLGRAFFIWVSVFNLFAVSVFWALIVDIFDSERGKRLFGLLAAAATIGAIGGSGLTSLVANHLSTPVLLIIAVGLIQVSVFSAKRLSHCGRRLSQSATEEKASHSSSAGGLTPLLIGIRQTLASPYLLGICGYILFYSVTSTLLYFQQAAIVQHAFSQPAQRTTFFANIDLAINVLTLICQLTASGKILSRWGVALSLALLPLVSILGFGWLGVAPSLSVLVGFTIVRRSINFALARPSREILFTVVPTSEKYHAKVFIDTLVYRVGDQVGAWSYQAVSLLGVAALPLTLFSMILAAGWAALSVVLGRAQQRKAQQLPDDPPSSQK
ncbi:MFS transporter [bacteria symbiont BFo2 of Frankliniella occidentalis]|nr:MFS transporter [bacteria symbiont BFo2 of Frankliniella occidentalis]KYP94131.1 MFS transporter [bacteria symbiont BFo2 of Frankliniella occidentalis]KYP95110.1 MFS transporter [bacteria symbiont BFo2 of Frankliniella occidentalis]